LRNAYREQKIRNTSVAYRHTDKKMQLNKHSNGQLSIYYTAGYPTLDSTVEIAKALEDAGVDFLEIGFP
jgi:tryptophan synthase alpha subunit